MNDVISLAVVLAINLFLLGAVIAGGLALAFRFIENVSPRLRYVIAVCVFLLAVMIPAAVTLKAPGPVPEPVTGTAGPEANGITGLNNAPADPGPNTLDGLVAVIATSPIGGIFLALWGLGSIYLLFREAAGLRQLHRARKEWEPATDVDRAMLHCPTEIPLYFAKDQNPGTAGFLYPVIVMPGNFPASLSPQAIRLVVEHEAAHARWRDPLVNSFLRSIRAFLWISPALWLIERLIESEREAAADMAAIAAAVSDEPDMRTRALVYAETLMAVAKNLDAFGPQGRTPRMIGLKSSQSRLEDRVRRLLSSSRTTHRQVASAAAAFVMALAVMTVIPVAALSDKTGDVSGESAITDDIVRETINERPDSALQSDIVAETKKAAGQAPVTRPAQKAAVRGSGRQNEKFAPLSPLRGQLAPLKTDHMAPLKTDHMAELGPLRR